MHTLIVGGLRVGLLQLHDGCVHQHHARQEEDDEGLQQAVEIFHGYMGLKFGIKHADIC